MANIDQRSMSAKCRPNAGQMPAKGRPHTRPRPGPEFDDIEPTLGSRSMCVRRLGGGLGATELAGIIVGVTFRGALRATFRPAVLVVHSIRIGLDKGTRASSSGATIQSLSVWGVLHVAHIGEIRRIGALRNCRKSKAKCRACGAIVSHECSATLACLESRVDCPWRHGLGHLCGASCWG